MTTDEELAAFVIDGKTNIPPGEASAIMDAASYRLQQEEYRTKTNTATFNSLEILHEGKWKAVGRTDLKDDVGTNLIATKSLEQWVAFYKKHIVLGARFDDECFNVIDRFSDA